MINVVNDRLQAENPPNGWPITAESGWQEYHNKVDQPALLCSGIADGLRTWGWQLAAVRLPPGPGRELWRGKQTKAPCTQRPGDLPQMALEQKNTTTRWIKHLKKSLRTWPMPVSTRQFLRAQQQHRLLNGILPWKPTGLHIMVVSERAGLRMPQPKERGGQDEKLHGQSGMRCTGLYRTVSP